MARVHARARKSQWQEYWEKIGTAIGVILGVGIVLAAIGFIVVLEMDVPGSEAQVTGTLMAFRQIQSRYPPQTPLFLVKLDSGQTVEVGMAEGHVFRKGKRVQVFEQTTKVLGRTTYRFGGYLEEEKPFFK
jgi:preprotein translocase subunit Sss1